MDVLTVADTTVNFHNQREIFPWFEFIEWNIYMNSVYMEVWIRRFEFIEWKPV